MTPCVESVRGTIRRTMNRWAGKVAIVTGSSSGIGVAISKALVSHGVIVVGLARRLDKLQELAQELGKDKFFPIQCDLKKEEDILKAFKWTEQQFKGVDILVNNAGVVINAFIIESSTQQYRDVIDTNLIAPTICSREAIQSMRKRNVAGHVININSIAGQFAETLPIPLGMYCPSKYGLRALGTQLRHEIIMHKLNIKITNISPGSVRTNMLTNVMKKNNITDMPILLDKDIADLVIYTLGTPESVEIPEITVIPQCEIIGVPREFMKSLQTDA